MSHAPTYATLQQLKAAVQIPDGLTDADLTRSLAAASRAIDKATGRRFWLDEEPVTRRYTAVSRNLVVVDDVSEIHAVLADGAELSEAVWFPGPSNADLDAEPFLWIESEGDFSTRLGAVSVTGLFGWAEVPDQVHQISMVIATKLFKRLREAPFGIVGSSSIEGIALRITRDDPDVELLLDPFKRAETVGHG